MSAYTDQEQENIRRVYSKAKRIMAVDQANAVRTGDFDRSLRIAVSQAQIESDFRQHGIDVAEERRARFLVDARGGVQAIHTGTT